MIGTLMPMTVAAETAVTEESETIATENTENNGSVSPMSLVTGASFSNGIYMLNNRGTGTWLTGYTISSNGALALQQGPYADYEYIFLLKLSM